MRLGGWKPSGRGRGETLAAVTKNLAEIWKYMDIEQRQCYVTKSELLHEKYTNELEEWECAMHEAGNSDDIAKVERKVSRAIKMERRAKR